MFKNIFPDSKKLNNKNKTRKTSSLVNDETRIPYSIKTESTWGLVLAIVEAAYKANSRANRRSLPEVNPKRKIKIATKNIAAISQLNPDNVKLEENCGIFSKI